MRFLFLTLLLSSCCTFHTDPQQLLAETVKVSVEYTEVGPKGLVASTAFGSGVTLSSSHSLSAVLTAAHVCHPPASIAVGKTAVQRIVGAPIPSEIMWIDDDQDLCILAVTGYTGRMAVLAEGLPPVGAEVTWTSGPLGLFGDGMGFVDNGHFAGVADVKGQKRLVISGVTTHGASGGPIFYHDRLIGIVVAVMTSGGYIILASPIDTLRDAIGTR